LQPRQDREDAARGTPDALREYIQRHPEWDDKLILIAREADDHELTIWTVGDVRLAKQDPVQR
jgi:hypothetical protein